MLQQSGCGVTLCSACSCCCRPWDASAAHHLQASHHCTITTSTARACRQTTTYANHPRVFTPYCAVQVSAPDYPDVLPKLLNVTTRGCEAGEYASDVGCTQCPVLQYSFQANATCRLCNSNANCTGGQVRPACMWQQVAVVDCSTWCVSDSICSDLANSVHNLALLMVPVRCSRV
jgi:hypothetical protein